LTKTEIKSRKELTFTKLQSLVIQLEIH